MGITCDQKCMFNWSAFEAQFNKANKFPGIINIIVSCCWVLISKKLCKQKTNPKLLKKQKEIKNELLVLFSCQIKKKIVPNGHSATSPNLPHDCQPI